MTSLLLILAAQLPLEIYSDGTAESRRLLQAVYCDVPCIDEDTRAIRHYQEELRRIVKVRQSLDCYVRIGQRKSKCPPLEHAWIVLWLKREIDVWNAPRKQYADVDTYQDVRFAGIVNLGEEGEAMAPLPMPWQESYTLTAFKPPEIEE